MAKLDVRATFDEVCVVVIFVEVGGGCGGSVRVTVD
jgi:hypothetical protein